MAQLGRYSYTSNVNPIMDKYGVSHASASMPATLFFFAYGIGQLINAVFCKRYNKRWVLGGVLLVSGAINLAIFIGVPFALVGALWLVNGVAQSTLWGSLILVLSENLDGKMLARASFIMSTATLGGTFLSYGISAVIAIGNHYELAFLISSVAMTAVCVPWVVFFDRVTRKKETTVSEIKAETVEKAEKQRMSRAMIFTVAVLAVFGAIEALISGGLQTWLPSILTETYGLSNAFSVFLTVFLPFVGVFSSLLSELMYKVTGDFIILNGMVFAVTAVALFALIELIGTSWIIALLLFLVVRLTTGVSANAITSRFPLYMRKKGNSGFFAGFFNGSCYVGKATSTYGFGALADTSGWMSVFWIAFALSGIPVLVAGVYALANAIKKKRKSRLSQRQ